MGMTCIFNPSVEEVETDESPDARLLARLAEMAGSRLSERLHLSK